MPCLLFVIVRITDTRNRFNVRSLPFGRNHCETRIFNKACLERMADSSGHGEEPSQTARGVIALKTRIASEIATRNQNG